MRYLGWGIGHRNSPNFPHEAHDLLVTEEDRICKKHVGSVSGDDTEHCEYIFRTITVILLMCSVQPLQILSRTKTTTQTL